MKKNIIIGLVVLLAIGAGIMFMGGDSDKKSSNENGIFSSSKKLSRDEGISKLEALAEKIQNGEITSEEYKKLAAEIKSQMESQEESMKNTNDNISEFNGMPSWAKALNIVEPKGLTLITEESNITKAKDAYPDMFSAVYTGNIKKLISESKRISQDLGLKIDTESDDGFMASGDVDKYQVDITVVNNGTPKMFYNATDITAQNELREKYNR